jgi:hypothetical protein
MAAESGGRLLSESYPAGADYRQHNKRNDYSEQKGCGSIDARYVRKLIIPGLKEKGAAEGRDRNFQPMHDVSIAMM